MFAVAVSLYFKVPVIVTSCSISILLVSKFALPLICAPSFITMLVAVMLACLFSVPSIIIFSPTMKVSFPILASFDIVILLPAIYTLFSILPFIVTFCPAINPYSRSPSTFTVFPAMKPIPSILPRISTIFPARALSPFTSSSYFKLLSALA